MTKRKHTPGPWYSPEDGDEHELTMGDPDGFIQICELDVFEPVVAKDRRNEWEDGGDEERANARLISAAPDLLEELEHLVSLLEPFEKNGELDVPGLATLNGARKAIAKATGKATQ